MFKIVTKLVIISLCIFIIASLVACASSPPPSPKAPDDSAARARAAGRDALSRLDDGGTSSSNTRQTTTQQTTNRSTSSKPAWVDNPESVYNRNTYVSAVGFASTRDQAEKNALANLSAFFGQSVESDQEIISRYNEVIGSGNLSQWSQGSTTNSTVTIRTSLDELIGAEIKEIWQDPSNNLIHAIAVMDKANTERIYNEMIRSNQTIVDNLINMSEAEKNSLSGYSRYQFAAIIADINQKNRRVLETIGATTRINLPSGNTFRMILQDIARAIPIGVAVDRDQSSRIQSAFIKGLSDNGFSTGNRYSRYLCDVNVVLTPLDYQNSPMKWTLIELTMNLKDTQLNTILSTYSFSSREGHHSQTLADNRAYMEAEKKINEEFNSFFKNYLEGLTPRR